ncbi:MAG: PucR family transcriptional regulator, partial [Sciscionella sp.]
MERLVPAVIERLPELLDEVSSQLAEQWPDYAYFITTQRNEVMVAARTFIWRLVGLTKQDRTEPSVAWDGGTEQPEQPVFEEIGRVQWQQGRDLTCLLSAYRVGARVAWHHVAEVALDMGLAPDAFASLAEAVFVFIDQLSSASARGYVREQSEAVATRERMRDELVELLLSDRSDSSLIHTTAARVGWQLPREATVVLIDQDNPVGRALLDRLDDSYLRIRRQRRLGVIVPDPSGPRRRERLAEALRGADAVVGHTVPLDKLPASVRVAEVAVRLQRAKVLVDDPVFVDEHM